MTETREKLLPVFSEILRREGMDALKDPKHFSRMVNGLTDGQLEYGAVLEEILREKLVAHFANGDLSSAEAVDRTAHSAAGMLAENYSLSYDWAEEVTGCLGEAIKSFCDFPRGQSEEAAPPTTRSNSDDPAHQNNNLDMLLKILAGALLLAVLVIVAVKVAIPALSPAEDTPVLTGKPQEAENIGESPRTTENTGEASQATQEPEQSDASKESKAKRAYLQYIQDSQDSAERVEEGKLVLPAHFESGTAYDGGEKTLLYEAYAIADINGDGTEELIVWYDDHTTSLLQIMSVFEYDEDDGRLLNLGGFASTLHYGPEDCRFYEDGVIRIQYKEEDYPSYVFINDDTAKKYDWSAYNLLSSEHHDSLTFYYDSYEGCLRKSITAAFDVPESVVVTEQEAEETMARLESGTEVRIVGEKFVK